jgi:hypothetical protein
MNMPIDHAALDQARAAAMGALRRNRAPHVFDLHPALHVATFAGFFAYLGIMWLAFGTDQLIIPFVIFAVFLGGAFIVPAWWARVAPPAGQTGDFDDFLREGVECETGHVTAGAAMVQVLIMPAMLLCWGLSVAIIKALV